MLDLHSIGGVAAAALLLISATPTSASTPIGGGQRNVNVSLSTPWKAQHPIFDILEQTSLHSPSSFLPLLESLSLLPSLPSLSPSSLLEATLPLLSDLLHPATVPAWHLGIAAKETAPLVEAFISLHDQEMAAGGGGTDELDEACGAWIEWNGHRACGVEGAVKVLGLEEGKGDIAWDQSSLKSPQLPTLYPFDHVTPASPIDSTIPPAILYFHPSSELFPPLLKLVRSFPELPLVVRYRSDPAQQAEEGIRAGVKVGGWGVEMVLKKMEYSSVDDRAKTGGDGSNEEKASPSDASDSEFPPFFDTLGPSPWSATQTPLSEDDILTLPLRSLTLLLAHPNPLAALEELSQNFPLYASSIALSPNLTALHDEASEEGKTRDARLRELWENRQLWEQLGPSTGGGPVAAGAGAGRSVEGRIWLGGREVKDAEMGVFGLLPLLRQSLAHSLSLTTLGFTPLQVHALLSLPTPPPDLFDGLVDASDRPELGNEDENEGVSVTSWLNDIETESRYASWRGDFQTLLRPSQPGAIPQLRRNIFNVVFSVDLSSVSGVDVLTGQVNQLVQRGLGVRFGFVPVLDGESGDATKMARLTNYLMDTFGKTQALGFLRQIIQSSPSPHIPLSLVHQTYVRFVDFVEPLNPSTHPVLEFVDIVTPGKTKDRKREKAIKKWEERLDLAGEGGGRGKMVFVNGKGVERDETQGWLRNVQMELSAQISHLMEEVAFGRIREETPEDRIDASVYFYDLPQATKRRNGVIFEGTGEGQKLKIVDMVGLLRQDDEENGVGKKWIYPDAESRTAVSIWIAGDLDGERGLELVRESLKALEAEKTDPFRLTFVHFPSSSSKPSPTRPLLSTLLHDILHDSSLSSASPSTLLEIIDKAEIGLEGASAAQPAGEVEKAKAFWESGKRFEEAFGLGDGEVGVVINGRVVKPSVSRGFSAQDFSTLILHEINLRIGSVRTAVQGMYENLDVFDRETISHLVVMASCLVSHAVASDSPEGMFGMASTSNRNSYFDAFGSEQTSFELGYNATALLHFTVILDPLSETAQRWSTTLKVLSEMDFVYIKVILLPVLKLQELPLKRFYRLNLHSRLSFDGAGHETAPTALFSNLPQEPIFTLGVDTPSSWLVIPRESIHDLDNLRLSDLSSNVQPIFELQSLIVEGHARDVATGAPPRGLQLQLTDRAGKALADTSVMANLGYFQLKANPGVLQLSIREGRGREIYELDSIGTSGWDSPPANVTGSSISVTSFSGLTLFPRMRRKAGMETADVLDVSKSGQGSFVGSIKSSFSSFFGAKQEVVLVKKNADINIFTVASGLLYERFAFIMAISVMRHTNSTVKFWFIENFLSPSFLEFIPHLANEYGFDYELVTYKWPTWLIHQKEKQRLIWGYKILFLDVLFPMDLEKVIFVDADQIVRTDLKELVDEDLYGAPYGYAPMGSDKEEMEGFRFWKTGYWKDSLRGKPYHISALYVVDLNRFRQIAAGDRLRGQYQALSNDPNSLSNLDQDLPNSMQDQIRIHTLDQSWLWCATWCSQESLKDAKTIDLCQDPLTKEPKLVRARKIPEWEIYDGEVAALALKLSQAKIIRSGTVEIADLAEGVVKEGSALKEEEVVEEEVGRVKDEL